jgi:NTE family protein
MRNNILAIPSIIGLLALIAQCCTPIYNSPKDEKFEAIKYDIDSCNQDRSALIFASFSGGGTRAACMSWESLKLFKEVEYNYINNGSIIKSNLAEQVDYISGISGGSFSAAAWGIFKDSMEVFDERFVNKNIERELAFHIFQPLNLIKSISPFYNRINIASEFYDKDVFNNVCFRKLPRYPVIWINSTALAIGLRFTYTQEFFDYLNSDIKTYPIGYACAASSAFPILLDPITLKNYGETQSDSILLTNYQYKMAKLNQANWDNYYYCKTIEFMNDKNNKWIHMADGGLTDNQGLQVILDQFKTNGIINKAINDASEENPLRRLIFININAGTEQEDNSCEKQSPPNVASVIQYTMTISMDRLSAKRWEEIKLRSQDKFELMKVNGLYCEEPYFIDISFRNIEDSWTRNKCLNLPTSFKLDRNQIKLIKDAVKILINNNKELNRLKEKIK